MQLGLAAFSQLKTNTPINHDPAINAMVQQVGKRIAAVASPALPKEVKRDRRLWRAELFGPVPGHPSAMT